MNRMFWKLCCCGVFTKEEAIELTERKYPNHEVIIFKVYDSDALVDYCTATWISVKKE